MRTTLSLSRIVYLLLLIIILVWLSIQGKQILSPFFFACFFSLMLIPICRWIEDKIISSRILAILLGMLVVFLPIAGIIMFFSFEFINVLQEMSNIVARLQQGLVNVVDWVSLQLGLSTSVTIEYLQQNLGSLLSAPISYITAGLSVGTGFLTSFLLCLLFIFLLLLYRTGIKNFFLVQVDPDTRVVVQKTISDVQSVAQNYLMGLFLVQIILGIANSLGLWLIGVDYPIFWGFLAGFLAIIPYIGTFLGGLLPFLFTFATADSLWQPLAVIILFIVIQTIEGNILTPKVVGTSVSINPLAAIMALFISGVIWGVPGLILSIPSVAVLKLIFDQIDFLKPIGILLDDKLYYREREFLEKYDAPRYRLKNFFRPVKRDVVIIDDDSVEE